MINLDGNMYIVKRVVEYVELVKAESKVKALHAAFVDDMDILTHNETVISEECYKVSCDLVVNRIEPDPEEEDDRF